MQIGEFFHSVKKLAGGELFFIRLAVQLNVTPP